VGASQRLPPGPRMPAAAQTALLWARPASFLQACRRRYGPVFTLRAPSHPPLIFICDPADVAIVLKADEQLLRPGDGAAAVQPIVGSQSFMLQHGMAHRSARKALQPFISAGAAREHAPSIERIARDAIDSWPTDTPIELHHRLRALTLEVILRVITGRLAGPLDPDIQRLHQAVLAMLEITSSVVLTEPYLRYGPGNRLWQGFLQAREVVDQLLFKTIDSTGKDPRCSLLASFVALSSPNGAPVDRRKVRDNLMSIVLAGHETTAAQLSTAMQLLAHHPDAQTQLAAALRAGATTAPARLAVQEILRHSCVFMFAIPRTLTASIELKGHRCDPPAQILPCIHLLHHDPRSHPDPQTLLWDRYRHRGPDPKTWLPWGGGLRRCPGQHLAALELEIVLSTLLTERMVLPARRKIEHPRWRSVIVAPHANCRVILRRRAIPPHSH
jgi:cytochrome P450